MDEIKLFISDTYDGVLSYNINDTYVLFIKVSYLYEVFASPIQSDNLICIDEGQDLHIEVYRLLQEINRNSHFNVYGDINQIVNHETSIISWDKLVEKFGFSLYTLNENYRNSQEIVEYCKQSVGIQVTSLGIKTQNVTSIRMKDIPVYIKLSSLFKNRIVIICKNLDLLTKEIMECIHEVANKGTKCEVKTVYEVKGLEYDTAIVLDEGMSRNMRYIAYTRALSDLYVVSTNLV